MKNRGLLTIFLSILFVECSAQVFNILPLQFFSKPALMLVLIIYFHKRSKNLSPLKYLVTIALVFSWIGDVILLVEKKFEFLFIFGLLSFLLAHIFYIIYFWQIKKHNFTKPQIKPLIVLGIFIYTCAFYLLISPHLSDLKIPVLIYSLVISLMLITSFQAFNFEKQKFGKICIIGTILFVFSDSILAVNRFAFSIPFGSVFVISTYSIGQLLIMEGALQNLRRIKMK